MTSLSRLIKSFRAEPEVSDQKVISIKSITGITANKNEAESPAENSKDYLKIINDAQAEAENIVEKAKRQSEEILSAVYDEKAAFENERQQAFMKASEEGFNYGREEGHKAGFKEYTDKILDAEKIIDAAKTDYLSYIESAEEVILRLALKAAEKVVGKSLEENQDLFISFIKNSLYEAREAERVNLLVHPDQYQLLLESKQELEAVFPRETSLHIYPNTEVKADGCILETPSGRIDAGVTSQLEELKIKLVEMLERE